MTPDARESALAAFEAAYFAGEAPDVEEFCAAHQGAGPGLREAIADFLMVVEGLGAAAANAPRDPRAPETLGPYRLLRVLGEGGMGTVFLAAQTHPVRRQVAIKLVRPGHHAAALRARFERERQALARMNHEHIARVFEAAATDDGRPYLVMEYVEGQPITTHCDAWRLSRRARLELFVAVCDAIQHAHQKGVMHRDLKPSNVLVTMQGERAVPKVIDFGLARATGGIDLEDGSLHTLEGQVLGTPEYMSPEQTGLEGVDVDARTDVYSLGALLYELLVGEVPLAALRAGSVAAMQRRIREEEPVWPSVRAAASGELARDLRGDLDAIVLKALEKDREHRYQTALDLAADVGRHLRDEPVQAGTPGTWYRTRKYLRRHRLQTTIALVVLVGLLASLALAVSLYLKADEASRYFRLLATSARLTNADAEREALYPAWPRNEAAIAAWLTRHGNLADELPQLEGALRAVATRALPAAAADAAPRFADPLDQFVHDYLRPLIGRLRAWADPERGQVRGVRDDHAWAQTVHQASVLDAADAWRRAAAEVAAEPRYAGLQLTPQLGLVPLGRDPTSGLQEFAHLRSGKPGHAVPIRRTDGQLELSADTGIVFVLLPPGTFPMGAVVPPPGVAPGPNHDALAVPDEGPVHAVTLGAFLLARCETTQAQWFRLSRGERPSYYPAGEMVGEVTIDWQHPVENLDWPTCDAVLRHHALVLPTEAQWEYACRAGTTTPWFTGTTGASLHGYANVADRHLIASAAAIGFQYTYEVEPFDDGAHVHTRVGSYRPNAFGLFDMHGNVAEWCRERHGSYDDPVTGADAERPARASRERIYRGGSFIYSSFNGRCADRDMEPPATANRYRGVRAARVLQ